jgi:multisubunit Na+/H+ antiporter MnhG subunit
MQYARTQRQSSYFETIVKIIVNSVGLVRFMECNQYQLWNASNYISRNIRWGYLLGAVSNQSVRQNIDVAIDYIVILLMYFLHSPITTSRIMCCYILVSVVNT